jgi:hypothetical protein
MVVHRCLTLPAPALHSHPATRPHPTASLRSYWIWPSCRLSRPAGHRLPHQTVVLVLKSSLCPLLPDARAPAPHRHGRFWIHQRRSSSLWLRPRRRRRWRRWPQHATDSDQCAPSSHRRGPDRAPQAPMMVLVSPPPRGRGH